MNHLTKKTLVGLLSLSLAASALGIDRNPIQVTIDVKFLTTNSSGLDDLGVDTGFGAGATVQMRPKLGASVIPFLRGTWERFTGDHDLETNISGISLGGKFLTKPNDDPNRPQLIIVGSLGAFRNHHKDEAFSRTKSGTGYDIGFEYGVPALSKIPTLSLLFSKRPNTFGKSTELIMTMASFPVSGSD